MKIYWSDDGWVAYSPVHHHFCSLTNLTPDIKMPRYAKDVQYSTSTLHFADAPDWVLNVLISNGLLPIEEIRLRTESAVRSMRKPGEILRIAGWLGVAVDGGAK